MKVYMIQSESGQFFRPRGYKNGYQGTGEQWIDNQERARIFPTRGGAQGVVTWWNKNTSVKAEVVTYKLVKEK